MRRICGAPSVSGGGSRKWSVRTSSSDPNPVDTVNKDVPIKSVYNAFSKAAKSIEKGLDAVNKFVPIGSVLGLTPLGISFGRRSQIFDEGGRNFRGASRLT